MPSTITLSGLPHDATVRELKNFCRLCPGFEGASATLRPGRPPLLFVKFFTDELASQAILQLQQLCFDEDGDPTTLIRAEVARSELSTNFFQPNGAPPAKRVRQEEYFDPAPSYGIVGSHVPAGHSYSSSAPTVEAGPNARVLACKKDYDYDTYHGFFARLHGFEVLRYPSAGGSCFAKFANSMLAQEALNAARNAGFPVEFARRELDESSPLAQQQPRAFSNHVPVSPPPPPPANAGYASAGTTRTLAIRFKGHYDQDYAKQFFTILPGFEALKVAVAGGNCFVRFSDYARAHDAMNKATQAGFTLSFARRELEEPGVSHPTPVTAQPTVPRMPVCNTLACKMEIHTEEAVKAYFAQCAGFEILKVNAVGNNCFVKFYDQYYSQEALRVARVDGFVVDFAKRELEDSVASEWGLSAPTTDVGASTLSCKTDDLGEKHIKAFFGNMQGFETLKLADTGKVCYLKFSDPASAKVAMNEGKNVGLVIEFAK